MTIQNIGSDNMRPNTVRDAAWREHAPAGGESPVEKGRPSKRLDRICARIASGFYDDPSAAHEVARRVLASGDLGGPST